MSLSRAAGSLAGAAPVPVVWAFLGYEFQAAPMIAGLTACLTVRLYIGFRDHSPGGKMLDATIMLLTLLFTAGMVLTAKPDPFYALLYGTGIGALGAKIISIAMRWVSKIDGLTGGDDAPAPAPPSEIKPRADDATMIAEIMRQLGKIPPPIEPPKE